MIAADAPPAVRPSAMWLDGARAARRDHRHVHRVGDRAGDVEVVARRGAVAVDAVDDDLAGAEVLAAPHPVERVEAGGEAGAVDEDLVAARDAVADADVLHLRAEHDALATERLARPSRMMSGLRTAIESTLIFSAPALSTSNMSSTSRMPPPTVNGTNTWCATARTVSRSILRFSALALMS